jgi:hypothetical protein
MVETNENHATGEVENERPASLLEDWITRQELAAEFGINVATLARMDARREGPPRQILGGKVRYHRPSIPGWLLSRMKSQVAA